MSDTKIPEGYEPWGNDAFEELVAPFYFKKLDDGTWKVAFYAQEKHANSGGAVHGGMLMTAADCALFAIAREKLNGPCVTVGFNAEFVSAAFPGDLIEASGEIVRETRSLIFVRGTMSSNDQTVLSFSGIIKRVKKA